MDSARFVHKILRDFHLDGPFRVDTETGLCSILDIIQLICQKSKEHARATLNRMLQTELENNPDTPFDVPKMKINGVGHETPVGDASLIIEIIIMLPNENARAIKYRFAEVVAGELTGNS